VDVGVPTGHEQDAHRPRAAELDGLAREAYLRLDFDAAITHWERAYAAYRAAGEDPAAVRAARNVAYLHGSVRGDWAVAGGWLARARRLADDAAPAERGWVCLTTGMFEADRARKEESYREAMTVAEAVGDATLMLLAMSYYGASLVHGDRTEEGMVLLDEALAAATAGELSDPVAIEEIFCQLFSACEVAHDVDRADQWIRVGTSVAEREHLPSVAAYCHTHYGGVMTAAGRYPEAEASLIEGIRLWTLGWRTLRAGAVARLADLRVRQGRLDEAEALLADLAEDAESARPRAALCQARGDLERAGEVLERALAQAGPGLTRVPLLAQLVEVQLAAEDVEEAASTLAELLTFDDPRRGPYVGAVLALARGRLALASGSGDAVAGFRDAIDLFGQARLPLEAARARLELASACAVTRPEVALAEARAALDSFERLRAARHVDAAAALLRSLGIRVGPRRGDAGPLTARETEVLELLGRGLSNRQVAERLVLSPKTVEHHVSSILAKLGLRNRSEAAAYAVRHGGAPPSAGSGNGGGR
jgi:DNA-binding CsgD family transcriptional regulator